jgi:hypothetical protein
MIDALDRFVALDWEVGLLRWKSRNLDDLIEFHLLRAAGDMDRWNSDVAGSYAFRTMHNGLLYGSFFGHKLAAHRVVWMLSRRQMPPDRIYHTNGSKTDNRPCNLTAKRNAAAVLRGKHNVIETDSAVRRGNGQVDVVRGESVVLEKASFNTPASVVEKYLGLIGKE